MTGWFRLAQRRKWHFFSAWKANNLILIPACKREIFLRRTRNPALKSTRELPPFAKLCRGCTATAQEVA